MSDTAIIENLKRLILIKTNLKLISPSDCKAISLAISKEVNKNISETTIKRLFGFAATSTNFSKFTINALTEFVSNLVDQPPAQFPVNESITAVVTHSRQITNSTLQNIRSRCSVPYELTIPRKFAEYDFHDFYTSNFSFTAFIAQPGHGKTILLSHLVNEIEENVAYKDAIVCFFDAAQLFDTHPNAFQPTLEESIKAKLGLPAHLNLINYFENYHQDSGTQLLIFLDGFAELVLNRNSKIKIFDNIINLISAINESKAIKIILSMRPTTWNRFYERIRHAHFLKKKWFPGSYYYLDYNANVPPLSERELELIIEKLNPGSFKKLGRDLKSQLKFPFHIQWYYKLKEKYPLFYSNTNVTFYEIIDFFISEKIFKSNYATEKIFFCKQIVKLSEFGKNGFSVLKEELLQEISVYKNTYMELLADGILMEERVFQKNFLIEHVRFVQPHIFEYFLFTEILAQHHQKMDMAFFKSIQQEYLGNQVRFQLMQWAVRHCIMTGDLGDIVNLFTVDLTNYEKNYLIYFIAENIKYKTIDHPEIKQQINDQNLHKILLNELVHFDFVDSCYLEAVETLIDAAEDPEDSIIYHSILAIVDCLSMDQGKLAVRLQKIALLKMAPDDTCLSAMEIINLIYLHISGTPAPATNKALIKFEAFKLGEICINTDGKKFPDIKSSVDYILILVLNIFYGERKDLLTIVNVITKNYPQLLASRSPFSIYLLNLAAITNARVNPGKKTDQMERLIAGLYENKNRKKPTLYSQSLQLMLKAQQCKNKKDYATAICLIKEAIPIFKRNNLFIYELIMYDMLIAIYVNTQNIEKVNQYNYKKLLRLEMKNNPFLSLEYLTQN